MAERETLLSLSVSDSYRGSMRTVLEMVIHLGVDQKRLLIRFSFEDQNEIALVSGVLKIALLEC